MNDKIKDFTDLNAWKESHALVVMIYKTSKNYPDHELFGIVSQMRRAAVSITSNIAEGFSRFSYKDKARFYYMAQGSLTELQNQLIISRDVGYIGDGDYDTLWEQLITAQKLINGLIKKSKEIHAS